MTKLLLIFIIAIFWAYQSEKYSEEVSAKGQVYSVWKDKALIMLIVSLTMFAGLRTQYNDTWNYTNAYKSAPVLFDFLMEPENLNPFTNPLFYAYQSLLRSLGCSAKVLIFTTSLFTQTCFVLFFKRYSKAFTFSIFIYFTLGTFCVSLAAMKQVTAMAMLTLGFPFLEKKKWGRYCIIVFLAMLLHTYAAAFIILPLFRAKPWKAMTCVLLIGTVFVLYNFRDTISGFMEDANELGKTLADYEVFDVHGVNILRVAVYGIPPIVSLLFRKWLYRESASMDHVLVHMSIISLCFMLMGTQAGANMFARMAHYFEIGTVCCLPWLIKKPFTQDSYHFVRTVSVICFLIYFVYAFGINGSFDNEYRSVQLFAL